MLVGMFTVAAVVNTVNAGRDVHGGDQGRKANSLKLRHVDHG